MFQDNYGFLIIDEASRDAVLVDPADKQATTKVLSQFGSSLNLGAIWNTHHHPDHISGNRPLLNRFPDLKVYASSFDSTRIPGVTHTLGHNDTVALGNSQARVFAVPGHTDGHIAYYIDGNLFCGDTVFVAGCGRLFEGTAAELYASISSFLQLPDETKVYCAHEYTLANMQFALSLEGNNEALLNAFSEAQNKRAAGEFTVPTTIGQEKAINPFMRVTSPEILKSVGLTSATSGVDVFAKLRKLKDTF